MKTLKDKLNELTIDSEPIGNFYQDFMDANDLIDEIGDWILAQDIVYYFNAIEYIKENDPSMVECFELAADLGFETVNLNSELLASLLYQQRLTEELSELVPEIEDCFELYSELED